MVERALTALLLLFLGACGGNDLPGHTAAPSTIRVGVLPDQDLTALERRHVPLIGYLERATGLDLELQRHDSYDALSQAFNEQAIDLAWFGGLTFVRAQHATGAEPLVMRDIDNRFTSHFIVRQDAPGTTVEDFKGARLAFGAKLSTSGHLMPRHFLNQRGIDIASFFSSVRNTRTHDETARLVRDSAVDIGAVNSVILMAMVEDGRLHANDLRVLEVTPKYANYVWAVQADMQHQVKVALRDAFLALDLLEPEHGRVLKLQGAGAFMPASAGDFAATRAAALEAGLLEAAS